nr:uncharacterized protein LOC112778438 [Arachis hypogaea]
MDPAKVEAVMKWERPTSVTEIKSFLGLAGYYQKFIKEFSQLTLPLTKLTRKDTPFVWNPECEESFYALKQRLITAPMLKMPEPSEPFEVKESGIMCLSQLQISSDFKSDLLMAHPDGEALHKLRKYTPDESHVLKSEPIQVREGLTLPVIPVRINDTSVKRLRRKEVSHVKVAWSQAGIEEHT